MESSERRFAGKGVRGWQRLRRRPSRRDNGHDGALRRGRRVGECRVRGTGPDLPTRRPLRLSSIDSACSFDCPLADHPPSHPRFGQDRRVRLRALGLCPGRHTEGLRALARRSFLFSSFPSLPRNSRKKRGALREGLKEISDWSEEKVDSATLLKLIYHGRFLHGSVTLQALSLPPGKTTVMHLVTRENLPEPNSQGASPQFWRRRILQRTSKSESADVAAPVFDCSILAHFPS